MMTTLQNDFNSSMVSGVLMSANGSRDHLNDEYASKIWPSILFLSVVMVTGSCGNLLVCVVYRFDFSKVNNRFILALAGVDLVNCLTSIPGELSDLRFKFSFGDSSFCPAMRFFAAFCSLSSASILVAISVDRFQKICKPFGNQTTLKTSAAAIFTCCFLSVCCALPAAFINGKRTITVNGVVSADCSIADDYIGRNAPQIYNGFFFILFICACTILVVMYTLIWKKLRTQKIYRLKAGQGPESAARLRNYHLRDGSSSNNFTASTDPGENVWYTTQRKDQSEKESNGILHSSPNTDETISPKNAKECETLTLPKSTHSELTSNDVKTSSRPHLPSVEKTTMMMLLVTVVFIVSFLPYVCLTTAQAVDRKSFLNLTSVQLAFYNLFLRSHFLNSALNPFIYSFFGLDFRKQLRMVARRFLQKFQ